MEGKGGGLSNVLARRRVDVAALAQRNLPVVAGARGRGAVGYARAGELLGDGLVDAGLVGCGGQGSQLACAVWKDWLTTQQLGGRKSILLSLAPALCWFLAPEELRSRSACWASFMGSWPSYA